MQIYVVSAITNDERIKIHSLLRHTTSYVASHAMSMINAV